MAHSSGTYRVPDGRERGPAVIISAIDPGKKCLPVCIGSADRLTFAAMSVLDVTRGAPHALARMHLVALGLDSGLHHADRVVVEQMQMNKNRDTTHRQAISKGNALLAITQVASSVASALRGSLEWAPIGTWKGTAPKHVTRNRVRKTLRPEEIAVLDSAIATLPRRGTREPALAHNLYDCAGIWLWATGRYKIR